MLRNAQPGDCPNGGSTTATPTSHSNGRGAARTGRTVNQVCADIDYEITVPADVALRVSTISGNIDIAGLTGAIEAKSISGFVDVTWPADQGAELSLKTITGEVYTDQDVAFSNRKRQPHCGLPAARHAQGQRPARQARIHQQRRVFSQAQVTIPSNGQFPRKRSRIGR